MRLTRDQAFILSDQFTDFVHTLVGQDVAMHRNPDTFSIEVLRQQKRIPHPTRKVLDEDDSGREQDVDE